MKKILPESENDGRQLITQTPLVVGSSLEMIESLIHMRAEIISALMSVGKYDQCLRVQEWVLLEELAAFLKTFQGLTELVSTKTTSLSSFHFCVPRSLMHV